MSDDGELDLNSLNDEELVQQVHDDLYDGLKEEVEVAVHILLKRGWTPYKVLTEALVEGMRDDYVVLVGGAPLNEDFAKAIGADAYCRDAAVAVETAKSYMAKKHNQLTAN